MTRWFLIACVTAVSCAGGPPRPEPLALGAHACAQCRMVIVSRATAAQIVAPGEEPIFFDEIGCLRDALAGGERKATAAIYVADYRTGEWVAADRAVFTRTPVSTPMASGLVAHADAGSRDADPAAQGGEPIAAGLILGPAARSVAP